MPERLKIGGSSTYVPEPIGSTLVSNIREMLKGPPVLVRGGGMGHNRELWKKRQAELQKAKKNPPPAAPMMEIIHDRNGRIIETLVKAPNTKAEPQAVPRRYKPLRVAIRGVLTAAVLAGGGAFIDHAWGAVRSRLVPSGTTQLTVDQSPLYRIFNHNLPAVGFWANPRSGDKVTITLNECDKEGHPTGKRMIWTVNEPSYGAASWWGEPRKDWSRVCIKTEIEDPDGTITEDNRTGVIYTGDELNLPGGVPVSLDAAAGFVDSAR